MSIHAAQHPSASAPRFHVVVPGAAVNWHDYLWKPGHLEDLRAFVARLDPARDGVRIHGNIGLTTHPADVLRCARLASIIILPDDAAPPIVIDPSRRGAAAAMS